VTSAILAIGEKAKPRRDDLQSSIEAGDHTWNAVEREADGVETESLLARQLGSAASF